MIKQEIQPKEKNQSTETDPKMTDDKIRRTFKKIIINLFHMFMNIEESMSMLMRHGK